MIIHKEELFIYKFLENGWSLKYNDKESELVKDGIVIKLKENEQKIVKEFIKDRSLVPKK